MHKKKDTLRTSNQAIKVGQLSIQLELSAPQTGSTKDKVEDVGRDITGDNSGSDGDGDFVLPGQLKARQEVEQGEVSLQPKKASGAPETLMGECKCHG